MIEISEKSACLLAEQAAARGKSLRAWVEELAEENQQVASTTRSATTRAAVEGLLDIQRQVGRDPEGWTIRDYIDFGRS